MRFKLKNRKENMNKIVKSITVTLCCLSILVGLSVYCVEGSEKNAHSLDNDYCSKFDDFLLDSQDVYDILAKDVFSEISYDNNSEMDNKSIENITSKIKTITDCVSEKSEIDQDAKDLVNDTFNMLRNDSEAEIKSMVPYFDIADISAEQNLLNYTNKSTDCRGVLDKYRNKENILGYLQYFRTCQNPSTTPINQVDLLTKKINNILTLSDGIANIKSGKFNNINLAQQNSLRNFLDDKAMKMIESKMISNNLFGTVKDSEAFSKQYRRNVFSSEGYINIKRIIFSQTGLFVAQPYLNITHNNELKQKCFFDQTPDGVAIAKKIEYDLSKDTKFSCVKEGEKDAHGNPVYYSYNLSEGDVFTFNSDVVFGKSLHSNDKLRFSSSSQIAFGFLSQGTTLNDSLQICGFSETLNKNEMSDDVTYKYTDLDAMMDEYKSQGLSILINFLVFIIPEAVSVISSLAVGGVSLSSVIGLLIMEGVSFAMQAVTLEEYSHLGDAEVSLSNELQYLFKARNIPENKQVKISKFLENVDSQYKDSNMLKINNASFVQESADPTHFIINFKTGNDSPIQVFESPDKSCAQHALRNVINSDSQIIPNGSEVWFSARDDANQTFVDTDHFIYDNLSPYQVGFVANKHSEDNKIHFVAASKSSAYFITQMLGYINQNPTEFANAKVTDTENANSWEVIKQMIDKVMFSNKIMHLGQKDTTKKLVASDLAMFNQGYDQHFLNTYFSQKVKEDQELLADNYEPTKESLINILFYAVKTNDTVLIKEVSTVLDLVFIDKVSDGTSGSGLSKKTIVKNSNLARAYELETTLPANGYTNYCQNEDGDTPLISDGQDHILRCTMIRQGLNTETEQVKVKTLDTTNTFLGGEIGDCFGGSSQTKLTFKPGVDAVDYNMCYYGDSSNLEPLEYSVIDQENPDNQTTHIASVIAVPDDMIFNIGCNKSSDEDIDICSASRFGNLGESKRNLIEYLDDDNSQNIDLSFRDGESKTSFKVDHFDAAKFIDTSNYGELTEQKNEYKGEFSFSKYLHNFKRFSVFLDSKN